MKAKTITPWVPALGSDENKDKNAVGSSTWFPMKEKSTNS